MRPVVLFRASLAEEDEQKIASYYFPVVESRMDPELLRKLVVGRYSVLPYYSELVRDLKLHGAVLINSLQQHQYVANFDYYADVEDLTPKTYFELVDVPREGSFVLKGRTNSRKYDWATLMYAKDRDAATRIYCELSKDPMIGPQGVVIREFKKLSILEIGINDMPMADEWRFFYHKTHRLSHGFYWSCCDEKPVKIPAGGLEFADKVAARVAAKVNFFVLDIARQENGEWILVEINDGQMSGLSENDPRVLYENLAKELIGDY